MSPGRHAVPQTPEIRAAILRLYLQLEEIPAGDAAALRDGLGPDGVRRVERASTTEWLPVSLEVAMLRAVHARRGEEGVRAVARALGRSGWRSGLFRPLLTATVGMMGPRPTMILRFAIASWHLAMRHAGTGRILESGPGSARVLHEGLPAGWDPLLALRVCATIEALLEWGGVSARAEAEWTPEAGRAIYAVTWR